MFHKRNLQPLYAICHARLPHVYRPHAQWPICFLPYCCFIRLITLRGIEAGFCEVYTLFRVIYVTLVTARKDKAVN